MGIHYLPISEWPELTYVLQSNYVVFYFFFGQDFCQDGFDGPRLSVFGNS